MIHKIPSCSAGLQAQSHLMQARPCMSEVPFARARSLPVASTSEASSSSGRAAPATSYRFAGTIVTVSVAFDAPRRSTGGERRAMSSGPRHMSASVVVTAGRMGAAGGTVLRCDSMSSTWKSASESVGGARLPETNSWASTARAQPLAHAARLRPQPTYSHVRKAEQYPNIQCKEWNCWAIMQCAKLLILYREQCWCRWIVLIVSGHSERCHNTPSQVPPVHIRKIIGAIN